jgi:hypothetical protein
MKNKKLLITFELENNEIKSTMVHESKEKFTPFETLGFIEHLKYQMLVKMNEDNQEEKCTK